MHKSKKERIIVKFFFGGEAKFGAEGSSKRFIELATKDTRVQGVRMFVPRTVEAAKKIYNDSLEYHKSMRAADRTLETASGKMKGIAVAVSDGAVVRTWFVNKIQGINVEREN